ncbi:alpha/beta fold hydrolase [Bacillus sp. 179-C3.3 HS]|uniref:alpha/beta fold hydrolase n=1 Tax=Bacillus sp. 179-C3.3 HS TaxID=3232162 RepID=UPI0039A2A30E
MNSAIIERTYHINGHHFDTKHRQARRQATIIFEAGYGVSGDTWTSIARDIDPELGVFLYDRLGTGNSSKRPAGRTLHDLADDLDALLHKANIKPPYLIVAHSFGSLVSRLWANRRKKDVIGMVLLDPASEYQEDVILPLLSKEEHATYMEQFTGECTHRDFQQMLSTVKHVQTHYGMMPLLVLSSGKSRLFHPAHEAWLMLHKRMLSLSSQSGWIQAQNSSHYIHHDEPHIVQLAIYDVWCAAKQPVSYYQAAN